MKANPAIIDVHPVNREIRGHIANRKALSESMGTDGQQNEIVCVPGDGGRYLAIDGGSRLAAAKELGLKEVEIVVREPMSDSDVRRYILTTAVRFPFPEIIISDGIVVGGMCKAIVDELSGGRSRLDISRAYNLKPDVVSAYRELYSDVPEIQQAVASGRMSITVYSRIKFKGDEFKRELVDSDGELSYERVRRAKKRDEGNGDSRNADSADKYTFNPVSVAVDIRDKLWEMGAHKIDDATINLLRESAALIDQLLGGLS